MAQEPTQSSLVQGTLGLGTCWLTALLGRRALGSRVLGNLAAAAFAWGAFTLAAREASHQFMLPRGFSFSRPELHSRIGASPSFGPTTASGSSWA